MRQILPDPWAHVPSRYKVGEIIDVTISRLVPFGAFVALDGGIEAIIPNSELSRRRVNRPEDIVSVGETVQAKIIDIKPERNLLLIRGAVPGSINSIVIVRQAAKRQKAPPKAAEKAAEG